MSKFVLDMGEEEAALEIVLAQFARRYRDKFSTPYPTSGDPDLEALCRLGNTYYRNGQVHVAKLLRLWLLYLDTSGPDGTIIEYEKWVARYHGEGVLIRADKRFRRG